MEGLKRETTRSCLHAVRPDAARREEIEHKFLLCDACATAGTRGVWVSASSREVTRPGTVPCVMDRRAAAAKEAAAEMELKLQESEREKAEKERAERERVEREKGERENAAARRIQTSTVVARQGRGEEAERGGRQGGRTHPGELRRSRAAKRDRKCRACKIGTRGDRAEVVENPCQEMFPT